MIYSSNNLSNIININENNKIAIVGCRGKTTTMFILGEENKNKKTLLTTTTKIFKPENNYKIILGDENSLNHKPEIGIQILANQNILNKKKLSTLKNTTLDILEKNFDIFICEGDGSKNLPLKAWTKNEPVIPNFINHTIGIITTESLNQFPNERNTLRLELFLDLVNIKKNEIINFSHVGRMITNKNGMFKNSFGKKTLIINQVETKLQYKKAKQLILEIKKQNKNLIDYFIIGSGKLKGWDKY